jgi:signal peptidase I
MNTQAIVSEHASCEKGAFISDTTQSHPSLGKQVAQIIAVAVLAAASYLLVSHFLVQSVQVVGASMYPTLRDSDHYLLNRWAYHVHQPKRSDIVVAKDPTDGAFVVKRIIAMPGDSIMFKEGKVYVNGRQLKEPYVASGKATFLYSQVHEQMIVCGANQYFILGDNRDNSYDSRMYGPVHRENILGVVVQ